MMTLVDTFSGIIREMTSKETWRKITESRYIMYLVLASYHVSMQTQTLSSFISL